MLIRAGIIGELRAFKYCPSIGPGYTGLFMASQNYYCIQQNWLPRGFVTAATFWERGNEYVSVQLLALGIWYLSCLPGYGKVYQTVSSMKILLQLDSQLQIKPALPHISLHLNGL